MLPRIDDPSEHSSTMSNRAYYRRAERSIRKNRGAVYLLLNFAKLADYCNAGKAMIEVLPEEILLEVFAFYVYEVYSNEKWKTLVHVCRRWRSIVFAAPRRLNLQLICDDGTPPSKMLRVWPPLPIVVRVNGGADEIGLIVLTLLEERDRICKVEVDNGLDDELKELVGVMKVPFPALTDLCIHSLFGASLPESLLGGSAPNLRTLHLMNVAFPALPNLLSSSSGLVSLSLFDIPHSWYTSFEAMVDCLSSLTRLEYLEIGFNPYRPRPNQASRHPPPLTRTVFPVLSEISLRGVMEYLDQILAHIEAPLLNDVHIEFFDPPTFDTSRITACIGHMEIFGALDQAYVHFRDDDLNVVLSSRKGTTDGKMLKLSLRWKDSGWKLLELTQGSSHPFLESFDPCGLKAGVLPSWTKNMGNAPWSHLIRFLTATESMYLTHRLAIRIAPALKALTGAGVTEVLPVLRNVFVERLDSSRRVQNALGHFAAARQLLSGHPVDVQCWERERGKRTNRSGYWVMG